MSSEMRELIRKEVEQWVGITRNRDIERSARVWMEGYDAALTYCADRISALLARTEAGADLRGGNVRFDVRLKNVEAGADGAVAWILRTGHGTALHEGPRPPVEGVGWKPLFDRPQDASGDAAKLSEVERKAVTDLMESQVYEAGDVDDEPPSIDEDEDAYWAYHNYHCLRKLLAAMQAKEAK